MNTDSPENPTHSEPDQGRCDEQANQPPIGTPKTDQESRRHNQAPKKKKRPTKHFVRISNLVIQGLLLFVGLAYCWFSWMQWTAMREQIYVAQQQIDGIKGDQRAWVTVTGAKLVRPLTVGEKPSVQIELTNSGKTPEMKVKTVAVAYIASSGAARSATPIPKKLNISRLRSPRRQSGFRSDMKSRTKSVDLMKLKKLSREQTLSM